MKNLKYLKKIGICLAVAGLALSSCGGKAPETPGTPVTEAPQPEAQTQPEQPAQTPEAGTEETGTGAGTGTNAPSATTEEIPGSTEHVALYSIVHDGNPVYEMDAAGNCVASYDMAEVTEKALEYGYDLSQMVFEAACDGVLYYYNYEQIGDRYGYRIYAVDAATGQVSLLWTSNEGWTMDADDLYEGQLHITTGKDDQFFKEYVFAKKEGEFSFTYRAVDLNDFFSGVSGYSLQLYSAEVGDRYSKCCASRTLDACGFVLGRNYSDKSYVQIFRDGSVGEVDSLKGRDGYVRGYDDEFLIFENYDDSWNTLDYTAIVFGTGEENKLPIDKTATILGLSKGILYYAEDKGTEYMVHDNVISSYDLRTGDIKHLYEEKSVPGTGFTPGTGSFFFRGGKIYYLGTDGKRVTWKTYDTAAGTGADTGLEAYEVTAFAYGTVDYAVSELTCPYCGIYLSQQYEEVFILDGSKYKNAEKINASLREHLAATGVFSEDGGPSSNEYCEDHQAYPQMWDETIDEEVTDVKVFSDRYLAVYMNGYWYGGGAHGYPMRAQHVYDLETGDEIGIGDLYTGTEEEFKRLVANYTQGDYDSYDDYYGNPYFAEDSETAYNQAYDYAGFNMMTEFAEDGLWIIYPPYEMGPYAAGYIEIFIPYRDLIGRDSL